MDFILFADDTNTFFSHKDFNSVSETLNTEMCKLTQWCRAYRLSINFKKSNFMVFRPSQRRQTLDLSIQIDNSNIDCVIETVFLGVILDGHLSWKPHILQKNVSRKISKSIGIIYKSSFCLPLMVFRPSQRRQTLDLSIQIDNSNIDCVIETVFLGVILDGHLSWKPHILQKNVSRKISKSIGIIYKSSFCLPKTFLHCLYCSLVYPYFLYCASVWGSTYQSNLNHVFILQKKITCFRGGILLPARIFCLKGRHFKPSRCKVFQLDIGCSEMVCHCMPLLS